MIYIRLGRIQHVDFLQNRDEGKVRLLRLWGIDMTKAGAGGANRAGVATATPLRRARGHREAPAAAAAKTFAERAASRATRAITCLAVSPDGRFVASGSRDASARIWDLSGKKSALALAGHTKPLAASPFFSDARVLTSSADQSVRILDVASGRERAWPQRTNWATALVSDHALCSGNHTGNTLLA